MEKQESEKFINRAKLRALCYEEGITMEALSKYLKCSRQVLYKRLGPERRDFTEAEIVLLKKKFGTKVFY